MAATFTVSGSNLIIDFRYTGPTQTITDVANNAANMLWQRGLGPQGEGITFAGLTNTQKLAILDSYIVQVFTGLAKEYYVQAATETARQSAEATAKTNLSIP
jgi:hypothetical protein